PWFTAAEDRTKGIAEGKGCGRRQSMERRQVFFEVLTLRVRCLSVETRIPTCLVGVVQDREVWDVTDLPARLLDAETEIRLLAIKEKPLIHEADALKLLPPNQHERATRPIASDVMLVNAKIEHPLTKPRRAEREALRREGLKQGANRVWEPTNRRIDLTV